LADERLNRGSLFLHAFTRLFRFYGELFYIYLKFNLSQMKKILLSVLLIAGLDLAAQLQTDTLAIQTFDTIPVTPPVWTFTGPVVYNSGFSSASAAPPNSPIGINGSRAWETTTNSGGLVLDFANILIPAGYDSVRVRFNLAAMNLTGTTGGPDDLDYVLTEISLDSGATFYGRLRNRGAVTNNSFWPYSATGVAKLYYQPQTEVEFQPANSGLQTTQGYSTNEIVFPGTITQVKIRMTGRSSTSSDTWLVDNLVITGEKSGTTALTHLGKGARMLVYPNPAQEQIKVFSPSSGKLTLYDLLGNEKNTFIVSGGTNQLDLSSVPGGIYIMKMKNEAGTHCERLILTK